MSENDIQTIRRIYGCFNARDIDGVLAVLTDDVAWANGMDGGHVHGVQATRNYWTRQWAIVSPHVEPVAFREAGYGVISVEVIQTVNDLEGRPLEGQTLEGQTHGLKDKTVEHIFHLHDGKITRFNIGDA